MRGFSSLMLTIKQSSNQAIKQSTTRTALSSFASGISGPSWHFASVRLSIPERGLASVRCHRSRTRTLTALPLSGYKISQGSFSQVFADRDRRTHGGGRPSSCAPPFYCCHLFSMYLRVSDLVGRDKWSPVMGGFPEIPLGPGDFTLWEKGTRQQKLACATNSLSYI